MRKLSGKIIHDRKLVVERALGKRQFNSSNRDRDRDRRKGPSKYDKCFNCNGYGHWYNTLKIIYILFLERANECSSRPRFHKSIDRKNKSRSRKRRNSSSSASRSKPKK